MYYMPFATIQAKKSPHLGGKVTTTSVLYHWICQNLIGHSGRGQGVWTHGPFPPASYASEYT